jgi:hypothetical protein
MSEREVFDRAAFRDAVRDLGITTVVLAWQEEYGQDLTRPGVVYDRLAHGWLLAYHRPSGTLIRCRVYGGAEVRAGLVAGLRAEGLTVEERERNEVRFRR